MVGRLYSESSEIWDRMAAAGRPSLVEMSKRFNEAALMDMALGMQGAVRHWLRDEKKPTRSTDRAAEMWLQLNPEFVAPPELEDPPVAEASPEPVPEESPSPPTMKTFSANSDLFEMLTGTGLPMKIEPGPIVRTLVRTLDAPVERDMLVVFVDRDKVEKARRVLALMGCEVVE